MHALMSIVGLEWLELILQCHADPVRAGRSGVPDLFLYAVKSTSGDYGVARFVEVKRPRERLSAAQFDELEFMRSLGLPARVLRLQERA